MTKKPKRPVSAKSRWKRVGKWVLIVGLVGALLAVGGFIVLYQAIDVPKPNEDFETQTSFVYYSDGETQLGQFATQNRESISLDEMPDTVKDAVVAAEDRTFWTNQGIDPKGIIRAAFSNARGNDTQGASTITQQYVKILYLTQERTLTRKVKEAFISLKLQREISKEQILEGYLNTIYFGRGAYGVQAASKAYFDIEAKELNLEQSVVLASVLNDPNDLDPAKGKRAKSALKERYAAILNDMAEEGMIERDGGGARRRSSSPTSPTSPRRASTAASAATCSRWSATSWSGWASTRTRSRAAGCASPRPSPATPWTPRWRASSRRAPTASATRSSTSASPSVEPGHRGGPRHLRGPGLPRLADQLGGVGWPGRFDDEAGGAWSRRSRTASRSRTPSTATRRSCCPTAPTSRTRATRATGRRSR